MSIQSRIKRLRDSLKSKPQIVEEEMISYTKEEAETILAAEEVIKAEGVTSDYDLPRRTPEQRALINKAIHIIHSKKPEPQPSLH